MLTVHGVNVKICQPKKERQKRHLQNLGATHQQSNSSTMSPLINRNMASAFILILTKSLTVQATSKHNTVFDPWSKYALLYM